jgi:hypothetical protein
MKQTHKQTNTWKQNLQRTINLQTNKQTNKHIIKSKSESTQICALKKLLQTEIGSAAHFKWNRHTNKLTNGNRTYKEQYNNKQTNIKKIENVSR